MKFVIYGKLNGNKVYYQGTSDNKIIWGPLETAVVITNVKESTARSVLKRVHTTNEYNDIDHYARGIHMIDLDAPECFYRTYLGRVTVKSLVIGEYPTLTIAARACAVDCKTRFPKDRWFMYKKSSKIGDKYVPFKYYLIDKTTGDYHSDYYFIEVVKK